MKNKCFYKINFTDMLMAQGLSTEQAKKEIETHEKNAQKKAAKGEELFPCFLR